MPSALKIPQTPDPQRQKENPYDNQKNPTQGKQEEKGKKKTNGGQRISLMNMSMGQIEYRSPQRNTNSTAMIFRKYSVSFRICYSCK